MADELVSVLVLSGGRSRRMGQDKVWMALDGVPLVERVVRRVLPVAGEILFGASAPGHFETLAAALRGEGIDARVVLDLIPGAGPLAGIHAGLNAARHDLLLALAADMPFVDPALITWMTGLARGFDAVVPQLPHPVTGEAVWEPLHALYRRTCLPAVTAQLDAGRRRVDSFLPNVRARPVTRAEIAPLDPGLRSFFNVNTPEDWLRAQGSARDDAGAPLTSPATT